MAITQKTAVKIHNPIDNNLLFIWINKNNSIFDVHCALAACMYRMNRIYNFISVMYAFIIIIFVDAARMINVISVSYHLLLRSNCTHNIFVRIVKFLFINKKFLHFIFAHFSVFLFFLFTFHVFILFIFSHVIPKRWVCT